MFKQICINNSFVWVWIIFRIYLYLYIKIYRVIIDKLDFFRFRNFHICKFKKNYAKYIIVFLSSKKLSIILTNVCIVLFMRLHNVKVLEYWYLSLHTVNSCVSLRKIKSIYVYMFIYLLLFFFCSHQVYLSIVMLIQKKVESWTEKW